MPDITFDSLEKVPEGLREHAKQTDGKFVVNVVPNAKLQEFRDNNIAISKERDAYKDRVAVLSGLVGEDPEKFKAEVTELRAVAQKVKDGQLKGTDAVQKEVEARLEAATGTLKAQLAEQGSKMSALEQSNTGWKSKYEKQVLHQYITNAVVGKDSIANPEALPDILARAEQVFRVKDEGIVPMKGDVVMYGSDGTNPMTPREWLTKLVETAPYLGKASAGGGARGSDNAEKRYGGLAKADFDKLPPAERIALARANGAA